MARRGTLAFTMSEVGSSDDEDIRAGENTDFCHFNEDSSCTTFTIDLFGGIVILDQDPSNASGHGFSVWDASIIFSKFVETSPHHFTASELRDKHILELGSGPGLAGIALMLRGAKVVFTDMREVVDLTEVNALRAYHKFKTVLSLHEPRVTALDWTEDELTQRRTVGEGILFDFVVLTDCIFSGYLVPHILNTILRFCSKHTLVVCAFENRDENVSALFKEAMSVFFKIKKVAGRKLNAKYKNDMVELLICKLDRKIVKL